MKRAILAALFCFVPCPGEGQTSDPDDASREIPAFEKRDSPASLLKRNPDGTLLVTMKPQVYFDELGCVMVSDRQGNTFSRIHHMIAFSLEEIRYWTIWGSSPGGGPPVKLDPKKDYKCLVKVLGSKQDQADRPCLILKIWEGDKVIYESAGNAEQGGAGQPATAPESKRKVDPEPQPESEKSSR